MPRVDPHRELAVWANGVRVGALAPALAWRHGIRIRRRLARCAARRALLSLSLPLTNDQLVHQGRHRRGVLRQSAARQRCHPPAAAGSLPAALAQRLRPARRDRTRLRRRRAVTAGGRNARGHSHASRRQPLTETQIASRARERHLLRQRPVGEEHEFRISIAGAQEKTALLRHRANGAGPSAPRPPRTSSSCRWASSAIARPTCAPRSRTNGCARASSPRSGCRSPPATSETFGAQKVLIVERFDRAAALQRQILAAAHAGRSGAGHRHSLASQIPVRWRPRLRRTSRASCAARSESRARSRNRVPAQLLFWMLAATDGHAKNFSIRILRRRPFPAHAVVRRAVRLARHRQEGERDADREGQDRDGRARRATALPVKVHPAPAFRIAGEENGLGQRGQSNDR